MDRYFKALDKIKELEAELGAISIERQNLKLIIEDLHRELGEIKADYERRLTEQSVELALMGKAQAEVQQDNDEELASYRAQNAALVEFVQQIADTKSKFAKAARDLLGQ